MRYSARILATAAAFALPSGCEPAVRDSQLEPGTRQQILSSTEEANEPLVSRDVSQLQARVLELERELAAARGAHSKLPDVGALLEMLRTLDGPGMSRKLETLLLADKPGHKVMYEFFHRCDLERDKILVLTHNPQRLFGMLRLVARYPDEVAKLCFFLMDATANRTESYMRREIFNFVPGFVNFHRGRFPELRQRLKKEIEYQLDNGGDYLYKVGLAMRDLDYAPPVKSFLPVLLDPTKYKLHPQVIQHLTGRGREGLEALLLYIQET